MTIANVAAMFKMSPLTLRLFEWRGLIRRRRDGNDKVFSWVDCERVALIVKAGKIGIAIGEVAPIIKAMNENAPAETFAVGRQRCLALIAELKLQQDAMADMLAELHRIDWELSVRHTANAAGISVRPFLNKS